MSFVAEMWLVYFFWAAVAWVLMALQSWRVAFKAGPIKTFVTVTLCAVAWPYFLTNKTYFR